MMRQIVLMYHDIYDKDVTESGFQGRGANVYKVQKDVFEKQIALIHEYQKNTKEDIVISFDDGGSSWYYIAAPLLEKYGYKGHFYIATDYIGKHGFLTENQIKELHDRGHIIGSHSASHILDVIKNKNLCRKDYQSSIQRLEQIIGCNNVEEFAFPDGFYNKMTLNILSELPSIKRVYTSDTKTQVSKYKNLSILGRYDIRNNMTPEYVFQIVSSSKRRRIIYTRWFFLHLAKQCFGENLYTELRRNLLRIIKK